MGMARRKHDTHRDRAIAALLAGSPDHKRQAIEALQNTINHLARGLELDRVVTRKIATTVVESTARHAVSREGLEGFSNFLTDHVLEAVDALIQARLVEHGLIAAPKRRGRR